MKASATSILPLIGAGSVNRNTSLGDSKMDMKPAYPATSLLSKATFRLICWFFV
jgi:hypothetical protein